MEIKKIVAEVLFFLHTLIFISLFALFLIPSSIWPSRIEFHFYYIVGIFVMFYLWGAIWTFTVKDKIYSICIVSTFTQYFRGYGLWDPRNYNHSFVKELLSRIPFLKLGNDPGKTMTIFVVFIAGILFVLKVFFGIVLY